jgi:hypothetical protein
VVRPLLGAFSHEAVAVDPVREQLYLTEDSSFGRLYRFTPDAYPDLTAGRLEAAVVAPDDSVTWVPVPEPRLEAAPQTPAATTFRGGEGIWYDSDHVYFTTKGDNRVWGLDTAQQTIEVLYDDDDFRPSPPLTGVDNVTVSPAGDIYVAEDGGNLELVLLSAEREVTQFLRLVGHDGSEITGPAFTPAGDRLYFSSQRGTTGNGADGITFEITGPFRTAEAPVPVVPEVSLPVVLPAAAVAVGAAAMAVRSRRDAAEPDAAEPDPVPDRRRGELMSSCCSRRSLLKGAAGAGALLLSPVSVGRALAQAAPSSGSAARRRWVSSSSWPGACTTTAPTPTATPPPPSSRATCSTTTTRSAWTSSPSPSTATSSPCHVPARTRGSAPGA